MGIVKAQNKTMVHGFGKPRRVDFSDIDEMIMQEAQSVEETKKRKPRRVHRPPVAGNRASHSPDPAATTGAFRGRVRPNNQRV